MLGSERVGKPHWLLRASAFGASPFGLASWALWSESDLPSQHFLSLFFRPLYTHTRPFLNPWFKTPSVCFLMLLSLPWLCQPCIETGQSPLPSLKPMPIIFPNEDICPLPSKLGGCCFHSPPGCGTVFLAPSAFHPWLQLFCTQVVCMPSSKLVAVRSYSSSYHTLPHICC